MSHTSRNKSKIMNQTQSAHSAENNIQLNHITKDFQFPRNVFLCAVGMFPSAPVWGESQNCMSLFVLCIAQVHSREHTICYMDRHSLPQMVLGTAMQATHRHTHNTHAQTPCPKSLSQLSYVTRIRGFHPLQLIVKTIQAIFNPGPPVQ